MLSRHFLRTKVLQSLYAYTVSGSGDLGVIEKNFIHNIERLNDLGVTQVSTLLYFFDVAKKSIEDAKTKFRPTKEEMSPNMRLVENRFVLQLSNNYEFKKACERLKINWVDYNNIFRNIYAGFKTTSVYKDYMEAESVDFKADKDLVLSLYKYILNYEALADVFVERNLLWEDDYFQIAQYTYAGLKSMDENFSVDSPFQLPYDKRNEQEVQDCDFAIELLKKTILLFDKNTEVIKQNLKQWEYDRVAMMDIIILKMAITEFTNFPSIPEKVTINEYIELSIEYSTDKSKLFINGILDKMHVELRSQGLIKKSGRGLLDENFMDE